MEICVPLKPFKEVRKWELIWGEDITPSKFTQKSQKRKSIKKDSSGVTWHNNGKTGYEVKHSGEVENNSWEEVNSEHLMWFCNLNVRQSKIITQIQIWFTWVKTSIVRLKINVTMQSLGELMRMFIRRVDFGYFDQI